ncbi:carbohydrate-binding protein [Spirosoma flavum]|uniref:Carbohydrate-binding protein n=1 Tax=Spirosoma flavum TaxID=2048557 RepID=A0ABW6APH6_9BACT
MKEIMMFLMFSFFQVNAATYYVKTSGGNGDGLSDANAWSVAKFASMQISSLKNGDNILFKRGDEFHITLQIERGGLTYGGYGTGANPVITGFTQLTSWTLASGNIYYASLDVTALNIVTLNGVVKAKGRYPNSGYLTYTSHSGNASVTGTSVGTLPFNPTGGEVVIRKERWILDRHPITARSSNTINYSINNDNGNNNGYSPVDGNGYFIQDHLSTLDQEGEWYYDKTTKRLYMHFGLGTPVGRTVKASTLDKNVHLNYWTGITFNNLTFEGGNLFGAWNIGTSNVTYTNCIWKQQGGDAIWGSYTSNVKVKGGSITDALNNSIYFVQEGNNTTVDGVSINNSGIIAGAGRSGDAAQEGISIYGVGTVIKNCSVINTGYNGINFSGGDNILVEHNFVDTFCTIKDDGGGIYTYNSTGSNRKIRNNIVLNAIGTFQGAESNYWEAYGKAAGIYLDGGGYDTQIDNNVVANGNWGGIFINGVKNHSITNNLVYNFSQALLIHSYPGILVRELKVDKNTFIAKNASQFTLYLHMFSNDNPSLLGSFSNNIYARPIDDTNTIGIYREYAGGGQNNISLAKWKSDYLLDVNSSKSMVFTNQANNIRFDYNYTNGESVVSLDKPCSNVSNTSYGQTIRLPAYGGSVLVAQNLIDAITYRPIPGKIEAESFSAKKGTCSEPTTDIGGGFNIGCVTNTSWLDYNVNVALAGIYTFNFRVSGGDGQIQLQNAQGSVIKVINLTNSGGFQIWKTISTTISLSAGKQTLRIYAERSGWNFNWFEVTNAPRGRMSSDKAEADDENVFKLLLYPNPAKHIIQIKHSTAVESGFTKIIKTDGREMKSQNLILGSTNTTIDIRLLETGNYILLYQNGSNRTLSRFIKE